MTQGVRPLLAGGWYCPGVLAVVSLAVLSIGDPVDASFKAPRRAPPFSLRRRKETPSEESLCNVPLVGSKPHPHARGGEQTMMWIIGGSPSGMSATLSLISLFKLYKIRVISPKHFAPSEECIICFGYQISVLLCSSGLCSGELRAPDK